MGIAEPNKPSLDALVAQLAAMEGRTDEALTALSGKTDAESILRRLTILVDAERFTEAAEVVGGQTPHERWCEKGTLALAAAGDFAGASKLVEWARGQKDPVLWPVCVVALARGRFFHAFRGQEKPTPFLPGELRPEQATEVRQALADLGPLLDTVKAIRRARTGIEVTAVSLATEFTYFLGEREENRRLADLLWERSPLPFHYAYAVMRKVIPPNPDLPRRLRDEHGDSFEAKRLAAFIEGILLGRPAEALHATRELLGAHRSTENVEVLAHLLVQLATKLPSDESAIVSKEAEELLGAGSRYARLRAIESELKANRLVEAEELLSKDRDEGDPNWLELLAGVRIAQGREPEAVDLLLKATELFPESYLLRKAAVVSERNGRRDDAIRVAERILRVEPDDLAARGMLARLYMQLGEYEKVAGQYREMRRLRPEEIGFGINEAVSWAFALRYEASLKVYDELCEGDSPPVAAVIGRAILLKSMNRAKEGFKTLEGYKDKFRDEPDYLKAYIDLGYSSKQEREAHWGLSRLHQLQTQGAIEKVLHEVDVNELIGMFRRHSENEDTLNRSILKGQCPWILAGQMLNLSPSEALRDRTLPLRWQNDDPPAWAKRTIYSTNGYVITQGKDHRWAESIEAAETGQSVVIDLSSLMTLQRLGLLVETVDYFGTCYYPAEYQAASLREQSKLVVHQLSRLDAARAVKSMIDAGRIQEVDADRELPFIHEHRPEPSGDESHSYGLVDLIPCLDSSHLLTDELSRNLAAMARRASGVDDEHPALKAQDEVLIDHSTLETLTQHELLKAVLSSFRVYVSKDDRRVIEDQLASWEERQSLWSRQEALWKAVKADTRFIPLGHTIPPAFVKAEDESEPGSRESAPWLPLYSAFLALEKNYPLLVDDRSCQMYVHATRRGVSDTFGTDAVLAALLESGVITLGRAADAYVKLITWRYRFIVLPVAVLMELAKRTLRSIPGQQLRRVSRYVQDCMRDPGLFAGPEQTDPPVALAHKLFLDWTNTIANFVVSTWLDASISAEAANALTGWALTECLPAVPHNVGPAGRMLADLQSRSAITQAFIRAASLTDTERVNGALVAIASALQMSEEEYLAEVVGVVHAL